MQQLKQGFSATGEFAVQRGAQHPGTPIAGWGGYGYLKKTFAAAAQPYLRAGHWAMSGDDPSTQGRIEGWVPIFSRWPKWSELYIYGQFREQGVAYWTNTSLWQAEFGAAPVKPLDLRFTWYRMGAYHPFAGSPAVFSNGTFRGNHVQARLGVNLTKQWSGHVLWESQPPGSFYTGRDMGYFLRFEVIFQQRWRLPAQWVAVR